MGGLWDPECWSGTSGWGVVCGCLRSPHSGPGVPFCCSGGLQEGQSRRCPLPGARPRLVALDGGCSRNKSKFLCAELGWMGGWDGGAVSNPKIALEAVPPSHGSAWVVWRSPAPLIRH